MSGLSKPQMKGGSLVGPDSWAGAQVTHYLVGEVQLPTYQRSLKREAEDTTYFRRTEILPEECERKITDQSETESCVMSEKFGGHRRLRVLDSTSL